ncbi:hypothetical protein BX600DRAFT_461240 [Xylariales sp. PMI_506]|nr:hypothetical protein BX600DRAFT_461240 [Xylariales sp. PMI_506]
MKCQIITILFLLTLRASAQLNLTSWLGLIPSCSYDIFASATTEQGCSTKDIDANEFDCLCKHLTNISAVIDNSVAINATCFADWATAMGLFCEVWSSSSVSATDFAEATSMLAADFAGQTIIPITTTSPDSPLNTGTTPTADSDSSATVIPTAPQATTTGLATAATKTTAGASLTTTTNAAPCAATVGPLVAVFGAAAIAGLAL